MNTTDATRASAEHLTATEIAALMPRGKTDVAINIERLRNCNMNELWLLRSALRTAGDIVGALLWNPNFEDAAAGQVLSDLHEFLCGYEDAAVKVAKAARPENGKDAEWRSWTILGHAADCADNLTTFSSMAVEAASNGEGRPS